MFFFFCLIASVSARMFGEYEYLVPALSMISVRVVANFGIGKNGLSLLVPETMAPSMSLLFNANNSRVVTTPPS